MYCPAGFGRGCVMRVINDLIVLRVRPDVVLLNRAACSQLRLAKPVADAGAVAAPAARSAVPCGPGTPRGYSVRSKAGCRCSGGKAQDLQPSYSLN